MKDCDDIVVLDAGGIEYLQNAAEAFRMGLFISQDGLLCFGNLLFAETLGYAGPEELLGKPLADLICPEDRCLMDYHSSSPTTDVVSCSSVRLITKSGKTLWMVIGYGPAEYRGRPAGIGYMIHAASIKTMYDTLKRYETILNNADLHLSELDLEGHMTFINDAGCRMWGVPREALIGDGYKSQYDPGKFAEAEAAFREIYRTGQPLQNYEYHYTRRDGEKRVVEDSISLIRNPDGEISSFVMAVKDITDRKEAEKKINEQRLRLEAIFGSVQDAIVMVDPQLHVIEANKSMEQVCGLSLTNVIGREFAQLPSHCSRACREALRQTLVDKTAFREHRIECDRQGCAGQVVSLSSSPLLDGHGNFMGAVLVIRDVTLLRDLVRELRERSSFANLIGRNKRMQDIYALVEDLTNLETTVLVTGESGTGKELIARALHYGGSRAFKPFITVNCSALTEGLLESELFGHVRGAFTGAIKDKQGRFAAAAGGTILLDEIGDTSPLIQLKLLRVLQEKEFERVGESIPQKVDVRVIACTNKDLKEKVKHGQFRQDLYYRLKVVEVALPPLRERLEDIPLLVNHFRALFNEKFRKSIEGISAEVLNTFMTYAWPGNIRELEHVMEHAFVLCHGGTITLEHLPADLLHQHRCFSTDRESTPEKKSITDQDIVDVLSRTDWNKAKAARILGLSRPTLYRKIDDLGLENQKKKIKIKD